MKKLLILTIALTIISCNSNDAETDTPIKAEYISENSISTNINFMPEEIYSSSDFPQTPLLKIKLITEEEFPCVNFHIKTTEFVNENELIIRFDGILDSGVCATAIGPAISYIDLPQNITKLTFLNGKVIDTYSIDINDEKITIELIKNKFTNSLFNKTFRIPKNSFAFVCGTNTNNTNVYEDFFSLLKQNNSFTEFEFKGEGRIPYPKTSSGHWVNHPSKFFIYSNPAEFENIDNLLNAFSTQNIEKNSGATIVVYGWNNFKYYSWD